MHSGLDGILIKASAMSNGNAIIERYQGPADVLGKANKEHPIMFKPGLNPVASRVLIIRACHYFVESMDPNMAV